MSLASMPPPRRFDRRELLEIFNDPREDEALYAEARSVAQTVYQNRIFLRGLLEFTNYCKENCHYCGLRRSHEIRRYRLRLSEIQKAVETAYLRGFRSFVLQGGEDPYWTRERTCQMIEALKEDFPDAALTLSIGVKSRRDYEAFRKAGADRYLLRHETADPNAFQKLHPLSQSLERRLKALEDLKKTGFQVGSGMMIEAPFTSPDTLLEDIEYLRRLDPDMIGVGPFLPHRMTRFQKHPKGSITMTRKVLSILRLEHPHVLLPATTALSSHTEKGHILGILSGANVMMPNITPVGVRPSYALYDGKKIRGSEEATELLALQEELREIGYEIELSRGDGRRSLDESI